MSTFADFAFVIDCTGSMGSWIMQCKQDIKNIVDSIGRSHPHIKLRLGCVAYRDWTDGAKHLEKLNFTTNVTDFKRWVEKLVASGGGDAAEDVLGGLKHCTTLDWSSDCRVLFHICDAPPHNKMYHDGVNDNWADGYKGDKADDYKDKDPHDYHKRVLRKFEKQRIHLCIARLNDSVAKMIKVFKEYADLLELTVEERKGFLVVEERKLTDPKDLLDDVLEVLTDAITRVDISDMTSHDLSEMAKVDTWDPLKTTKTEFQAYVGIDFGTDGTGFAIALPSGKIIMNETITKDLNIKDRTNILLHPNPPYKMIAFGKAATDKYSATKDKKILYFERFKMSLYDQELTVRKYESKDDEKTDTTSYLRAENGKLVETKIVFKRALEHVRKLVMQTLKDSDTLIQKVMDVQWILTVPSIWSNYAKSIMHEAASDAGIKKRSIDDHVLIAIEPECASVIARRKIDLSPGTKYILLDLGGGTADITCHQAIDENTAEQIYSPKGGPWGSSYIDEEYFKLLDTIFGKSLMDEFKKKSPNKWVRMKENFRNAKHKYDGSKAMNISLDNAFLKHIERKYEDDSDCDSDSDSDSDSDDEDDSIIGKKFITPFKYKDKAGQIEYDGLLAITPSEYKGKAGQIEYDGLLAITPSTLIWNDLFDCVIDKLLRETDKLLEQKEMEGCKDILLVGGLSESEYLKGKIRCKYSESYRIHSVQKPILAVVQGAAIMGLRPLSIAKWMAQETMGIQIRRPYDETTDAILPDTEKKLCKRQYVIDCGFFALIKKGTRIDPSAAPKIEWFRPWIQCGQPQVSVKLFSSDEENPIHTTDEPEGQKIIKLPDDWKKNEAFPIVYWDKGAEKKLYIGVRDWPEDDREICVQWKDPFSG